MTDDELEKHEKRLERYFKKPRPKFTDKIRISFEMLEHGWIKFHIDFSKLRISIWLSNVFDPLPDLIEFIHKLKSGALSAEISIDEEGIFKTIEVFKQDDDDNNMFTMKVTSSSGRNGSGKREYEVLKAISRRTFLEQTIAALLDLADKNNGRRWCGYDLSSFIKAGLEKL